MTKIEIKSDLDNTIAKAKELVSLMERVAQLAVDVQNELARLEVAGGEFLAFIREMDKKAGK